MADTTGSSDRTPLLIRTRSGLSPAPWRVGTTPPPSTPSPADAGRPARADQEGA